MSDRELARDIVGQPKPQTVGVCSYCGGLAPLRTVCSAHTDLVVLDPATTPAVRTGTTPRVLEAHA